MGNSPERYPNPSPGRRSVLEGMMVGLSELLSAAQALYQQVETVKANRAQLTRLAERIRLLLDNIRGVKQLKAEDTYAVARRALETLIKDAATLSVECQNADRWHWLLYASDWEDRLKGLHQRLDDCLASFGLSLNLQSAIDQDTCQAAIATDRAAVRDLLVTIIHDNQTQTDDQFKAIVKALEYLSTTGQAKLDKLISAFQQKPTPPQTGKTTVVFAQGEGSTVGTTELMRAQNAFILEAPDDLPIDTLKQLQTNVATLPIGDVESRPPPLDVDILFAKDGGSITKQGKSHIIDTLRSLKLTRADTVAQTTPAAIPPVRDTDRYRLMPQPSQTTAEDSETADDTALPDLR